MANLYTIIVDFQGGTYIAQSEGSSPSNALVNWVPTDLDIGHGYTLSQLSDQLRNQINEGDYLVPISTTTNVWCISGSHDEKLILVHVVLTVA